MKTGREMLRWLGSPARTHHQDENPAKIHHQEEKITDDPLSIFDSRQFYSVSRSVYLPRITLSNNKNNLNDHNDSCNGDGINPLFCDGGTPSPPPTQKTARDKSISSGYGSSNTSHLYYDNVTNILEQNPSYVKSIKIPISQQQANQSRKNKRSIQSSSSSGGGTLTTIPEGRVDLPIPKPIWPNANTQLDSLVDDALLLYTSLNYHPEIDTPNQLDVSVKEILVDLLNSINETMEQCGNGGSRLTAEQMLQEVNRKIAASIECLKFSTEEEMKKLCVNLSNCQKINSVLRAFGGTNQQRNDNKCGFISDSSLSDSNNAFPVFVHDDLASVSNGVRNAMIYGTLMKNNTSQIENFADSKKKMSLRALNDNKPSVWEQYYGVRATANQDDAEKQCEEDRRGGGEVKYVPKPTDVPLFPGGRPEADFTLDLPRSELLLKRMKQDKKWRCRCRLLTSFLGLIFFLLSVMAVSLMLTRGRRMFGSMM